MQKFLRIVSAVLSGDAMKYVIKHRKNLVFLFILAIIYICNGFFYALEKEEFKKLDVQLQKSKIRCNTNIAKYSTINRYTNLRELLKKHGLGDLKRPKTPPKRLEK